MNNDLPKNIDYEFLFTKDGSCGLYNKEVNDVYHSVFGAKEEAEEKFVKPLKFEKDFFNKKQLKILDICYGIGYNTKAILNKILKLKYNGNVTIDALEYDKNLVLMSPFIKDGHEKKSPFVSYVLLSALIDDIYVNKDTVLNFIFSGKNKQFIAPFYRRLVKRFHYLRYQYNPPDKNNLFLHNTYYHCMSSRNKKSLNCLKLKNFTFNTYFDDARVTVQKLDYGYDIIFLDAFTPTKLPTLWSLDFFNELFRLLDKGGKLVTYSNSAAVRNAMLNAGFCVGKLFDKNNRCCGTMATKNCNLIQNKLDDYDLGLIKTNAGIYYKDKGLCCSVQEILDEHELRRKQLNLESSSHYIKTHKKECTNVTIQ